MSGFVDRVMYGVAEIERKKVQLRNVKLFLWGFMSGVAACGLLAMLALAVIANV